MIFSPYPTELDAQRADIALISAALPAEVFSHLPFQLPIAKPAVDPRDAESLAIWCYFGMIMMPFKPEDFKELSNVKHFKHRLGLSIDSLQSRKRSEADECELELCLSILHELDRGAGHQKRIEFYAKYLGYSSFNDYLETLEKVNRLCKEKGVFSFVTLAHPGSYFKHRVAGEPAAALFGDKISAYEEALKGLAPFWLDATLLVLENKFLCLRIEPIAGLLVVFEQKPTGIVMATTVGATLQNSGTRWGSYRAAMPSMESYHAMLSERARQLFGDVAVEFLEGWQ